MLIVGVLLALAQQVTASPGDAPLPGKIVVYRGGGITGAAVGCPIRYKERELVELGRNKFAEIPVAAGRYILTNKTSSVEVSVDPGETRYVRCQIKPGMLSGRADLQIIDKESFDKKAAEYERKEAASIL